MFKKIVKKLSVENFRQKNRQQIHQGEARNSMNKHSVSDLIYTTFRAADKTKKESFAQKKWRINPNYSLILPQSCQLKNAAINVSCQDVITWHQMDFFNGQNKNTSRKNGKRFVV